MKRFHVHVNVKDLDESVRFYSGLFAATPSVLENDYAKWMLEDPRVNFAISSLGRNTGVDHLGIQAENSIELDEIGKRLTDSNTAMQAEAEAQCCYAKSEKLWASDPQGVRWESFHTTGGLTTYNGETSSCVTNSTHADELEMPIKAASNTSCCAPKSACC